MQRNIAKKRKEVGHQLDQVNDDLSDFSLSSPARKIRRLDAQLPPIMEEEEVEFDLGIEELENSERAIVPFNPINNPSLLQNTCTVSLSSDFISGFKEHFLRSSYRYGVKSGEDVDQCRAVVPWVPRPSEEGIREAMMEVEESRTSNGFGGGFLQWQQQQQHCMIPQPPHNRSTPITWLQ